MDVVDPDTRSRMMSNIKGKNTKPELVVRRILHGAGYRYRLHDKSIKGKPDIVLPKYRALIEVHGCFWHGHFCHLCRLPATRTDFWKEKIEGNVRRDRKNQLGYQHAGWRQLIVWECSMKGKNRFEAGEFREKLEAWILGESDFSEIEGRATNKKNGPWAA